MNFFVFDNVTNTLKIDDYNILLIKEFKALWEPNRNKCKEDKSGQKRLRATKEFTYLYLALDFKSPYFQEPEQVRHKSALESSELTEEDLQDETFKAAYRKYEEIQESNPLLSLIKTMHKTLFKMRVFYDNYDFNIDVDADGRPLYKPGDVIKDLAQLDTANTALNNLESKVKTELNASESKIRGGETPGMFD